ncbi:MAG: polymerase sigma-70 factor, subfamily [Labilithrix sp.]|nr:polymerase sigma-70 factor, subfamily [Labilithrix sp.]
MSATDETMKPMNADVIRSLVDNHREFLRFVESRVGNRDLAKEIVQEAFARGIDKIESLRSSESATAWFYRALRNAVIDHHRRQHVSEKALEAFAAELDDHVEPPEEVRSVVCQCVIRLAETLKPEYADALASIEVDGMPVSAFAERCGISSNNAAVRVFRARDALRKRVVESCGSCADHGCLNCTCSRPKA